MPIAFLTYSAFVDMFEPSQDFSGYEDDEGIDILWKTVKCKNPARDVGGWCAFLWKPASEVYTGKWIRQEYNGSSPFAMWWSDMTEADEQLFIPEIDAAVGIVPAVDDEQLFIPEAV